VNFRTKGLAVWPNSCRIWFQAGANQSFGFLQHSRRGFAGRLDEYLADIFIAIEKLGLPSEPMTVK